MKKISTKVDEIQIIEKFYTKKNYPLDDCFWDANNLLTQGSVLVTTDSLSSGVHFREDWSRPEDIAHKLVEVNVSDLVSSGGIPLYAFLNLGLSPNTATKTWVGSFAKELKKRLQLYKTELVGGDTFRAGMDSTVLTLTLLGKLHPKLPKPWQRDGGKPTDALYLSGPVGFSQWGYELLQTQKKAQNQWEKFAIRKHLRPTSRYDLLPKMVGMPIHACMDITDGLVQDLEKLASASNLYIHVFVENLPEFSKLQKGISLSSLITSGEELELAILAPLNEEKELKKLGFHKIGVCYPHSKRKYPRRVQFLLEGKPIPISQYGFVHFP